ncbi:hypothetical protein G9A89_012464 [Geosiphon pyriformis]|nr:hypothetical protein G9A89_012464 [Geosiphon pyriformis]
MSSCASESESVLNLDSNSDNNDNKNTSSSSTQFSNESINDSDSNSNPKIYIVFLDLSKKQKLKWYSDNNEDIMPERAHNTDTGFDLRYSGKEIIKLEPHLHTLLMRNKKELGITAKGIQGFGSTSRIDIPVNMVEEEIIDKGEIISIHQTISIPPYDWYILAIKKKVKNQVQLFEAEAIICKSEKIGLTNLYILAKSSKNIKISIYNTIENVIEIPKGTIIGYLTAKVEDQPLDHIPDFPQLCGYVNITLQTIYGQSECYLLQPEQLEQINMENLDPLQQMQLKMLLGNFNDIFVNENEFGRTNIIQHQIKTGDTMPIKQRTYRVLPASHEIIHQEINQMLDNKLI